MNLDKDNLGRIFLLVAHPDDETISCGGLLQRASQGLVLFAVNGAPRGYGFERRFGSLQAYSEERFREASRALDLIPHCSHAKLVRKDGTLFADQHLFLELPEAFASLRRVARNFSPDLLVSHAFEGGHIDHDACHVLAKQAACALSIPHLEFPLYWKNAEGMDIFQRFRENRNDEIVLPLSPREVLVKRGMLAEYKTQRSLASVFSVEMERFRPMDQCDFSSALWSRYPFENRWRQMKAETFFRKITEFRSNLRSVSPVIPYFD
jgi:N-acetylglucosamine malate deacetylase 2